MGCSVYSNDKCPWPVQYAGCLFRILVSVHRLCSVLMNVLGLLATLIGVRGLVSIPTKFVAYLVQAVGTLGESC